MASDVIESTRVFVSNLPRNLSSEQLASHFAKSYSITDAHVIPDRRIGFVGFHNPAIAQEAANHFHRSYIRLSKISVDLAKPVEVKNDGSGSAVPMSHRTLQYKSGKYGLERDRPTGSTGPRSISSESASIALNKRKRDATDDGEHLRIEQRTNQPQSDAADVIDERTLTTGGKQYDGKTHEAGNRKGGKDEQSDLQAPASDNDWLRGKTNRVLDLFDPDVAEVPQPQCEQPPVLDETTVKSTPDNDEQIHHTEESFKPTIPNGRLFIRNLAFNVTEPDLETRFSEFGKVQEVHLVVDSRKAMSKGTAFVQFSTSEEAEKAQQTMDGTAFHGRLIHILPASDKREHGLTEYDISKMPLKKQKAVRRKIAASSATFSWNSLYMNPDAVITSIADRLGVAKSDILDPTSADAAVKQAHAETQVIAETKDYLQAQGVQIAAFKTKTRDLRSILLKNFPFGTSETELRDLLEPYGRLTRFILPPTGTMAIAQYLEPFSASQALKALAYRNIKGSVLYLEKAPAGLLLDNTTQLNVKNPENSAPVAQPQDDVAQSSSGATSTETLRRSG